MIATLLSVLMCSCMGLTMANVYADEASLETNEIAEYCNSQAVEEGINSPRDEVYIVKDLNNNQFYIQTGETNGFMVYDPVVNNFIEKSASFESPYDFSKSGDYYYFGPMNYYERVGDLFYSLVSEKEYFDLNYANQLQEIFNGQLRTFRNAQSYNSYKEYIEEENQISTLSSANTEESTNTMTKQYINNYEIIKDSKHPSNYDGSCGFVAGSLILNYWDKTMHRGTVLDQYYDSNMNLNDTGSIYSPTTNLKDRLVELNGGNPDSWGLTVRDSLISYCSSANISANSSYYLGKIGLDSELANNRPVIIFGALPNVQGDGNLVSHAVTCYGTESDWWGGYYIVNYGWASTYNEVSLGFGFVGSVTTFQLNESSYRTSYTVTPSSYGYSSEYCKTKTTDTVNISGNTFTTNRLRCGYIENEYINLSARRAGYDTSYIEYNFTNPVDKININLSFWSDDERFNSPNIAYVSLDYQRLASTSWINKYDLLKDGNLPTDRKKQKTFTFEFPEGTKSFRIYSHFDYMAGKTDRNKGRISIGNMTIYTFR